MPKWVFLSENLLSNIQIYKFEKNSKIKQINMQVSTTKLFQDERKYGKIEI